MNIGLCRKGKKKKITKKKLSSEQFIFNKFTSKIFEVDK